MEDERNPSFEGIRATIRQKINEEMNRLDVHFAERQRQIMADIDKQRGKRGTSAPVDIIKINPTEQVDEGEIVVTTHSVLNPIIRDNDTHSAYENFTRISKEV
jgi:hypothetical protein